MKTCTKCQQSKPLSAFGNKKSKKDGKNSWCRVCGVADTRRWNREHAPQRKRNQAFDHITRRYGMTKDEFSSLLLRSSGKCDSCGDELRDSINVDHDHSTGQVRGLLCFPCNAGLGMFSDDIRRMELAVVYLRKAVKHAEEDRGF